MKVKDCMCNDVCSVTPDTTVQEVAKLMAENHVGSIPVTNEQNCLCGIVTDRDILLRSIVCDKDIKTTPISDIMTCNVCSCNEQDEMSNAQTKMAQNQIRRLPVCDSNNKVVGILTLGNLAQFDREIGKQEVCTTIENICNCGQNTKNAE